MIFVLSIKQILEFFWLNIFYIYLILQAAIILGLQIAYYIKYVLKRRKELSKGSKISGIVWRSIVVLSTVLVEVGFHIIDHTHPFIWLNALIVSGVFFIAYTVCSLLAIVKNYTVAWRISYACMLILILLKGTMNWWNPIPLITLYCAAISLLSIVPFIIEQVLSKKQAQKNS